MSDDLTDFLLARIAEDEVAANGRYDSARPHWSGCSFFGPEHMGGGVCDCNYSARVLAECEARRAIVAEYTPWFTATERELGDDKWFGWLQGAEQCVKHIAGLYADHPDFAGEVEGLARAIRDAALIFRGTERGPLLPPRSPASCCFMVGTDRCRHVDDEA